MLFTRTSRFNGLVAAVIVTGVSSIAYADLLLPPAEFHAYDHVLLGLGTGTFSHSDCISAGHCETATITLSFENGTSSVSVMGSADGGYQSPDSVGQGIVRFYFLVIGTHDSFVPVVITGSGSTSASAPSPDVAGAGFTISAFSPSSGDSGSMSACVNTSSDCGGPPSNSGFINLQVLPDIFEPEPSWVTVEAGGAATAGNYAVTVDPTVSFAPVLIPAASRSNSVQIPCRLLLLGSGIAIMLAVARSKTRPTRARNQEPSPFPPTY